MVPSKRLVNGAEYYLSDRGDIEGLVGKSPDRLTLQLVRTIEVLTLKVKDRIRM